MANQFASSVSSRLELAALNPATYALAYLNEDLRSGLFALKSGDAPQDPRQGLYVASTTSGYYWERDWDGGSGHPEWFGALPGDPAADNRTAFDACVALCTNILFGPHDYYISDGWQMSTSSRNLVGTAGSGSTLGYGMDTSNPMGMAGGTRIILTGPQVVSGTVFQFGRTFSANDNTDQMRNSTVRDIVFARDCSEYKPQPSPTGNPIDSPKGILVSFCSDCTVERVWSYDNPIGFHTFGVVISKLIDCSVHRITPASSPTHDFFVGFLHGGYGTANFGYIGNSASTYFIRCHVFDKNEKFDTSTGMRLFGRFADTFVKDFEMARLDYGIEIDGRDASGTTMSDAMYTLAQQDVSIENPVIDGCGSGGIWIHDTQDYLCLDIVNPYIASGGFSINASNAAGSIKVHGGRITSTGTIVTNVDGFGMHGTHFRDAGTVLTMKNAGMFDIQLDAFYLDLACTQAVLMEGCFRGKLDLQMRGAPNRATYAVVCDEATNLVEVNGSAINPGCFVSVDAANKVRYGGNDARAGFSSNILTGITG